MHSRPALDRRSIQTQAAEPLESRRLLSTTLFSTGFEVSNVAPASFTSVGYTPGDYLTGQPSAGTKFASAVTSGITGAAGSAVVFTYASTGITGSASNAQYVQLNDLGGIPSTASAYYFPSLSSISPLTLGAPVVDVIATIGVYDGANGAAFGLTAFDGTAAQNSVADLEVNAATGGVTVDNGARSTGFTQVTSSVTFDSYELQLDYATQSYNVYEAVSGATAFTNEIATGVPFETPATTFSTASIDTESLATSGTSTGLGLFDNFSIDTNAGPGVGSVAGTVTGAPAGETVYLDVNGNGALDTGELSTTTGSNGAYAFTNVPAGKYVVRQVLPTGYTQTSPAGNAGLPVTVAVGAALAGENFTDSSTLSGSISGEVFTDANDNGTLDSGESPLSGVTVYLDLNDNGVLDGTDPTYKVGSNGQYSFNYLPAGTFYVREVVPSGDTVTTPANDVFSATITAGQKVTGANFGNVANASLLTGSIAGEVFNDANSNGKLDGGESPLSGVTVYLDLNDNGVLDSTDPTYKVGSNGLYSFNYLPAGTFYIREVVPSGYTVTTPANKVFSATITTGQKVTGANFGNAAVLTGSISGEVFADANGNGKLDGGEKPIPGAFVFLDLNQDGKYDSGDISYPVSSNATYSFNYLPAGTFWIEIVLPSGYTKVTTPTGGLFELTITTGETLTGENFGLE
jgi:hypothetical protein